MIKMKDESRSGEGRNGASSAADILPDAALTPIHLVSYQQRGPVNSSEIKVKGCDEDYRETERPLRVRRHCQLSLIGTR